MTYPPPPLVLPPLPTPQFYVVKEIVLSGSIPTPALLAGHVAQGLSTCAANFVPDLQTSMMIL